MNEHNDLTCSQAQHLMQKMLDRRWSKPWPQALRQHLKTCQPCSTWTCLFSYEPAESPGELPQDFSSRIISQARRSSVIRLWTNRGAMLATAAALFLAVYIVMQSVRPGPTLVKPTTTNPSIDQMLAKVRSDVQQLPQYFRELPTPTLAMLPDFPRLELAAQHDPIEISLTSFKPFSESFQGAVEPLEAPARQAYQKVKTFMDEPEVKKWLRTVQ